MTEDHDDDKRGIVERTLSNPSAIATILIAVLGQAIFSVMFQISNNEQQAARIEANAAGLTEFKAAVNNLQTPLSGHVIKLESEVIDIRKAIEEIGKRINTVDNAGTRALALVASNQQREIAQIDRLAERIIMQDRKLVELEAKMASPQVQVQLDALKEQQMRIIQALDNNYNLLNEHLRNPDRIQNNQPLKR